MIATTTRAAAIAATLTASPDGATVPVDASATVPATGYVVADARHGVTLERLDADQVERWVLSNLDATPYLGIWADSATGLVYLDTVEILPDRADAMARAATLGEIAIWDLGASAEIRCA